jgi:hypothetical protein
MLEQTKPTQVASRFARRNVQSPYRRVLPSFIQRHRKFQAYCVGTAKSGTHTIAGLLSHRYRTAHEPEDNATIDIILAAANGSINKREIAEFVRKRDKRLRLELESSHFNHFFIDILVSEFRRARFILTIRDCYSWVNSFINHQLMWGVSSDSWRKLRDFRFRPDKFNHARQEQILADHGLYTLDGYLSYWAAHNTRVLEAVPRDRLLVLRTNEIKRQAGKLAEFLNIPVESLDVTQTHSFQAKKDFGLLAEIDKGFLEQKVNAHCQELMSRYFPEVLSLDDAL